MNPSLEQELSACSSGPVRAHRVRIIASVGALTMGSLRLGSYNSRYHCLNNDWFSLWICKFQMVVKESILN